MNKSVRKLLLTLIAFSAFWSCSTDDGSKNPKEDKLPPVSKLETRDPVAGIRVAWDFKTKIEISEENDTGYNGYARAIQLKDYSLLVAYESNSAFVVKKSENKGFDWSQPIVVSEAQEGVNMATPDLVQLQNGSILLTYNPRPGETAPPSKRFGIKTILSGDGGITWVDEQTVYKGGAEFINGVWEPSALQLPNGEIQLFFSNEGIYQKSDEQNISLLRSQDNGKTWTQEPEITSFRAGGRDGMPSPLYLKNQDEIVFSIEDNESNNQFKPYTIRNSVSENWSNAVDGNDEHRSYALKEKMEESEYADAPYLAQLKTGETLLSYQGTDNRNGNELNNADMKVVIGDENAKNFDRPTTPFLISEGKSALWNSIAVLEDNTVMALSTTNAFSPVNASEVWMIQGRMIPELKAKKFSLEIDGETSEDIWKQDFPVFIGQKGATQLLANISMDNDNLYVITENSDGVISGGSENIQNNDETALYLDPSNKNYAAPSSGVFKIVVSTANGSKLIREKIQNGKKLKFLK